MGVVVIALALLAAAAGAGYWLGRDVGLSESEAHMREAQVAATWATTPDGQLAYRWARTGELQRLACCEGAALTRERQQGRLACLARQHSAWWLP